MHDGAPSGSGERPAFLRAAHQLIDDDPKVLSDPVAVSLVEATTPHRIQESLPALRSPLLTAMRANFVFRSRFAEDELARAAARGVRQYVILGAGLDTFAYRQPPFARALRIFEVDHPATQASKRERLAAARIPYPPNLSWVPVDFERESFLDGLVAAGFDRAQPGFFSWLGVTQYLTLPAIDATLGAVASLPHPSGMVFSFVLPDEDLTGLDLEAAQDGATANAARGEPWLTRFRAEDLKARLRELGFGTIYHLTPAEVDARYFAGRRDGLRPHTIEQLLCATV